MASNVENSMLCLGFGICGRVFCSLMAKNFKIMVFDRIDAREFGEFEQLEKRSLDDILPEDFDSFPLVVNFLPVSNSTTVMRILKKTTRCNFVDLSSDGSDKPEQLELAELFAGRYFLATFGVAPGLDNILVSQLIREGAKEVHIHLLEHCFPSPDGIYRPSWSLEDAEISTADAPVMMKKGKKIVCKPFSEGYDLETLAGQFRFRLFFGEEVLSLGHHFPAETISLRCGGGEADVAEKLFHSEKVEIEEGSAEEPDGVFGVICTTDKPDLKREIILKTTAELREAGYKHGNFISFGTAFMAAEAVLCAERNDLKGLFFPETLPPELQEQLLERVKTISSKCDF